MYDDPNTAGFDSLDDVLDAGLAAAFREESAVDGAGDSVIATLSATLGIRPNVLLRASDEEADPVAVRPGDGEPDRREFGRFQVAGEIARGGVGVVLKGRDPDLGRDVAIKLLRDEHADRRGMVARFVEEAQIGAQLQHPGILPVYEIATTPDRRPYFAMKLIQGRTLAETLSGRRSPADDRQHLLQVFAQVCQAVAFAHAKGVVHRDLKPSNILLGSFGEVQVVDWGLAKVLARGESPQDDAVPGDGGADVTTLRSTEGGAQSVAGSVFGTPAYMCPEQARGEVDRVDERADVFALGAILMELLCGNPPYRGSREQLLALARKGDLTDTRERLSGSDADEALQRLALECLSADRSSRPRHAGVVADRVAEYLDSLEERARRGEIEAAEARAVASHERRAKRRTVVLGALLLAAVGTAAAASIKLQNDRRIRELAATEDIARGVEEGAELLGAAIAAPVGDEKPWLMVSAAAGRVESLLEDERATGPVRERAEEFLQRLSAAERDRQLVERVEEVVIRGATHNDKESWLWMEEALRTAFLGYGIDLEKQSPMEVAEIIRESDLSTQLGDALELWGGTCGHLLSMGVTVRPVSELRQWIAALYEADPDPFATQVRKLVYEHEPRVESVRALLDSVEAADVRPRTLSWLGSAAFRTGDVELVDEIFQKALYEYPGDFMLNFDHAYMMMALDRPDRAVRAYERCLAVRPRSDGVWRSLGLALEQMGDLEGAIDAIRRSIEHKPDYGPTHVDLGKVLWKAGKEDQAEKAFERAVELDPALVDRVERAKADLVGASAGEPVGDGD